MSVGALILVVEDNITNQLLTSSVLEREGYRVEVAGSSVEALELLRTSKPDLILMDIQLPGLDGLALTRMLKIASDTAAIPVVALTAHAMSGDREQALAAGCAGYISKPIDTRTFGEQVRGFLSTMNPASRYRIHD
ncbi:MAG TPA: response regulator [Candidatus Dormibacteraeota bacterium]|jgi:CheY-like chemotaxis protein